MERAERVICLLPARTDTAWWHRYVLPFAAEIHYLRGRIRFEGAGSSAPFPSAVVIFEKRPASRNRSVPLMETLDSFLSLS